MRIAFYAPLKSPTDETPSGDRRVARLLMDALARAGHEVELASDFRGYEGAGDTARQEQLRERGTAIARELIARWTGSHPSRRPDLWFTYHLYYKAPDWLGPEVSAALGIPYVIAEPSFAGKRAGGPWDDGHRAAARAIAQADLLFCPNRDDLEGLRPLMADAQRIVALPPFLDPAPYRAAAAQRLANRAALARAHGLDEAAPWIAVAAMMRSGDKLASYGQLADALGRLPDLPWRLLIAGDGPARAEVETVLGTALAGRCTFLGALDSAAVASLYGAADLCAWPAVNEAYGMAMLEAQAAGVPVVSCDARGVPEVMQAGVTGLMAPPGDMADFAVLVRALLVDPGRRTAMGRAAADFILRERSLAAAARTLGASLARLDALAGSH